MASFPHLIDVGIMGHCVYGKTGLCVKAGIGCYQSGLTIEKPNMKLKDFICIAEQCSGRCNQFALGGRGDPDQHENFEDILKVCKENNIVPNFTTSGYGMTPEIAKLCKEYCGAVAVSWYRSEYTYNAINMFLKAGVKTNIHYVLGNIIIESVKEGLERDDEYDDEFCSINVFTEESSFIKQIKEINSMDEIAKITIEGFEDAGYNIEEDDYSGPYANSKIVSYDLINKKGSLVRYGYDGYIETGEGTGGELNFSTNGIKRVSKKQPDDWYEEKKSD